MEIGEHKNSYFELDVLLQEMMQDILGICVDPEWILEFLSKPKDCGGLE